MALFLKLAISISFILAVAADSLAEGYPNPARLQSSIDAFRVEATRTPPPRGAIVATGSSSVRKWRDRIADDLAPLTIIPRGFGGSNMNDVLYYLDELVLQYRPRALLLYEGDNDLSLGVAPELILDTLDEIVNLVHEHDREVRIYLLSVKPSLARWSLWPATERTNRLFRAFCDTDERLTYVDVATPMLTDQGLPPASIFASDLLHMNDAGYDIWRDAVRPVLLEGEASFE